MKIVCPACNATYNVPDSKVPNRKATATCKRCGGKIQIDAGGMTQFTPPPNPLAGPVFQEPTFQPPPVESLPSADYADSGALVHYPELRSLPADKFDIAAILTPNKDGTCKSRKNGNKIKILLAVKDILGKVLGSGEKVMRIGRGVAHYPMELFFGNGIFTMLYNQYAIVATDRRLIFINVNSRMNRTTHYLFQMPYEHIKKVSNGILGGSLGLDPVKGKRRTFTSVPRYMAKELKNFVMERMERIGTTAMAGEQFENICPSCYLPLVKGLTSCPGCGAGFKEPKKAMFKSLMLPGWGDIYLGHRGLGILELIGSVAVWIFVSLSVIYGSSEDLVVAAIVLLFYNGIDAMLTYHMAGKGYMLAGH